MDPNPTSHPILSFIMNRFPSLNSRPRSPPQAFDIEQPQPDHGPSHGDPSFLEKMPHLSDPKVVSSMTRAIHDVAQTRSVLQILGPRPDHESVDKARIRIAEIDSVLSKQLEELVLSPRTPDVDRLEWRGLISDKEQQFRDVAAKERAEHKAILQLDALHEEYVKLLADAEERLEDIYETRNKQDEGDVQEEVLEDAPPASQVIGMLRDENGAGLEMIDLSNRNLKFLPEAFGKFHALRVLNLADNQFELIPDSIGGLQNLEELNLASNLLESLPDSIGLLQNLKILNLYGNRLVSLPDTICHCRHLVELDVSFNCLTYLPTDIGYKFANLQKLVIRLNKIRFLPSSIGKMRSLRHLDAHFNELNGLPLSIGGLVSLEVLNASNNFANFKELPITIGDLANLRELDLSNNQIKALPDTFGRLDRLVNLELQENPLVIPPVDVVREGVEAIKTYMIRRWIDLLVEEERKFLPPQELEQAQATGFLSRSRSWLKTRVSTISDIVYERLTPRSPTNPDLDQQL